jgi:hypothetical protein
VRLASALDAGLNLGRGTLDARVPTWPSRPAPGRRAAGDERQLDMGPARRWRWSACASSLGAERVALLGAGGQVLPRCATATGGGPSAGPERPDAALLRQARRTGAAAASSTAWTRRRLARCPGRARGVPGCRATALSLAARRPLPAGGAAAAPRSWWTTRWRCRRPTSEYQQRALARDGLRRMYIGTLTLALVLAVFGAVLLAILLGNQLAKPLLLLADGVRQVAAGDLTPSRCCASATNWAA